MAKKSLGQHFLKDQKIVRWIIEKIPEERDFLVEIGPGKGALTKHISNKNAYLYEMDDDLVPLWRGKEFDVIVGDAVKTLPETLPALKSKHGENFVVVSNLPYNAAAPIFVELIRQKTPTLILMFQREVADKIVAEFGDREVGRLTVLTNIFYEVKGAKTAKPEAFSPAPKVHSKVIFLKRREKPLLEIEDFTRLENTIKRLFASPRKMLRAVGVKIEGLGEKRPHEINQEQWIQILKEELLK